MTMGSNAALAAANIAVVATAVRRKPMMIDLNCVSVVSNLEIGTFLDV